MKTTKSTAVRLPRKPSGIIRVALEDLAWIESKPEKFSVNMGLWAHRKYDGKCEVCFAGAVMARSLNVLPIDLGDEASPHRTSPRVRQKLYALNSFREGRVIEAYDDLGREVPAVLRAALIAFGPSAYGCDPRFPVAYYPNDKARFRADMNRLANFLEAIGE